MKVAFQPKSHNNNKYSHVPKDKSLGILYPSSFTITT